jgi:hypothetical protein
MFREIRAMAAVAGIPVDEDTATRIATAMGPVLESFGVVGGTLPMDLEPALYVLAQKKAPST